MQLTHWNQQKVDNVLLDMSLGVCLTSGIILWMDITRMGSLCHMLLISVQLSNLESCQCLLNFVWQSVLIGVLPLPFILDLISRSCWSMLMFLWYVLLLQIFLSMLTNGNLFWHLYFKLIPRSRSGWLMSLVFGILLFWIVLNCAHSREWGVSTFCWFQCVSCMSVR
jgi:hypothetical protein